MIALCIYGSPHCRRAVEKIMKAKVMFTLEEEESKLPLRNIVNYESPWKKKV